jgi:hypothetical protein
MRDKQFVAVHRGGSLTKEQHRQLIRWARECSEHLLSLMELNIDERLIYALSVAKDWEKGNVTTGKAIKASLGAIAAANESSNPVMTAVARSIGHAVATAHMSDHSMGAALYALIALKLAGKPIDKERKWQNDKLPSELKVLVITAMTMKMKGFKILRSENI